MGLTYLTTFYENYPLAVYYLLGINVVTFFLYGLDKLYARSRSWRIRETTLLAFVLFGGTLGALLAIYSFRHKTRKDGFLLALIIILLLQLLFFYYYFSGK